MRSIPSVFHVIMLMSIIIYIYAIVGYQLFHQHDPTNWGNLGICVLTLFNIITLEGWTEVMVTAMESARLGMGVLRDLYNHSHVRGDKFLHRHHHQQPG